jgi:hypothetical protein
MSLKLFDTKNKRLECHIQNFLLELAIIYIAPYSINTPATAIFTYKIAQNHAFTSHSAILRHRFAMVS